MISIGRSEGRGSAEVTVISNEISSRDDGWVSQGFVVSHIEGCQAADALKQSLIASGMSGREGGGEMWYRDHIHHLNRFYDMRGKHGSGRPSQTGP